MYSDSESSNDDLDDLEALMERRLPRGKGKFKGKLPIICFTCKKAGHIVTRYPNREDKDEKKDNKYRERRDGRDNRG